MESLSEQTELGSLLYPREAQMPAALDLQVHGENVGEAAANAFGTSQQADLADGAGLASKLKEGGNGLANPLGATEGALDETSQLSEARSNLEESGGAPGLLDIATRRILLGRIQKQRHFCHVCHRECPSKHKLKRHLSTHSEERPFNCELCGKSFKWTEYLAKHMRQQHKGEALPPSLTPEGTTPGMSVFQLTGEDSASHLGTDDHELDVKAGGMDVSVDTSLDMSVDTSYSGAESTVTGVCEAPPPDNSVYMQSTSTGLTLSQSQTQLITTADSLMEPQPPSHPPPELVPLNSEQPSSTDIFSLPMPDDTQALMHHPALQTSSPVMTAVLPGSVDSQTLSPPLPSIPPAEVSLCHSIPPHQLPPPNPPCLPPYSMDLVTSQSSQSLAIMTDTSNSMPSFSTTPADVALHPSVVPSQDAFGIRVQLPHSAYGILPSSETGALLNATAHIEEPPPTFTAPLTEMNLPPSLPPLSQQPAATPTSPVTIIREEPPAKRRKKETVSVGIQCEVGHETLIALFEEEAQARRQAMLDQSDLEINPSALDLPHSRNKPVILHGTGYGEGEGEVEGGEVSGGTLEDHALPVDRVVHKYPCENSGCPKAYVHRKDLIRHMKIRHGLSPQRLEPIAMENPEKPFLCPVGGCDRSYFHMKDLRRHQRQCHQVSLTGAEIPDNPDGEVGGHSTVRFPCDFPGCLRSYVHKKDLVRHKRLYHKDIAPRPSVPVPLRISNAELKKLRQEEKLQRAANSHLDKSAFEKSRLDSIGSTASNSGTEDPPHSATLAESEPPSELVPSLAIARLDQLSSSTVEEFHIPDSYMDSSSVGEISAGDTNSLVQASHDMGHPEVLASISTASTIPQGQQSTPVDSAHLDGAIQPLSGGEQADISSLGPGYNFGNVGISDEALQTYAEQVKNSLSGQEMQGLESAPVSQYDPTSVLRSLAQATSDTPLPPSIQNVVNQLLAGTSGTEEMNHASF